MSELRDAYIKYADRIRQVLHEPTEQEKANLLPAIHKLANKDGTDLTTDQLEQFLKEAWVSHQLREIIDIIMEVDRDRK